MRYRCAIGDIDGEVLENAFPEVAERIRAYGSFLDWAETNNIHMQYPEWRLFRERISQVHRRRFSVQAYKRLFYSALCMDALIEDRNVLNKPPLLLFHRDNAYLGANIIDQILEPNRSEHEMYAYYEHALE